MLPMRILFITSNRIGDAVLSTGLLDHLIRTYPQAQFSVACGTVAAGVFARIVGAGAGHAGAGSGGALVAGGAAPFAGAEFRRLNAETVPVLA